MIEIERPSWKSFRTHEPSKTLHFLVSKQKPWNLYFLHPIQNGFQFNSSEIGLLFGPTR